MTDDLNKGPLEMANKVYVDSLWHKQFSHMKDLPPHLTEAVNRHRTVLQKYENFGSDESSGDSNAGQLIKANAGSGADKSFISRVYDEGQATHSIMARHEQLLSQRPNWHKPWELSKVIHGHVGWVRCVKMEPVDNEWFATGSNDSTIKIWDLATGKLKLTLAGHVMTVRDVAISKRHPYLFSASEDKKVKCWDLEKNMAIRDYHGHLSGVHTVDIHPTLDLIATAGRDSVVRLWDIRSRLSVMTLVGHKSPINKLRCLPVDPQVVSCSTDATVRLWDITAGKSMRVLTHHKRSIRDISLHPTEFSMVSACTDDIRSWKLPEGSLLTNFESANSGIINTLSVNADDVLFAGGDNGTLSFYDYKSGHKYQSALTKEAPGSLESERGILASTFDQTGLRLITGEMDKSIKIWKQKENATSESHPGLPWNPTLASQRL